MSCGVGVDKQNDKLYSLKLDKYREEQKQIRTTVKHIETLYVTNYPNCICPVGAIGW